MGKNSQRMAFQVDVSTLPSKFSTIFTTLSFPLWLHHCSNSSSNCWQSESESLETSEDAHIPAISAAFFRTSTASSIPALTFATRFSPVPALPDTSLLHDPSTCHAKELAAIARTKTGVKSFIISKRPSKNSRSQKNGGWLWDEPWNNTRRMMRFHLRYSMSTVFNMRDLYTDFFGNFVMLKITMTNLSPSSTAV